MEKWAFAFVKQEASVIHPYQWKRSSFVTWKDEDLQDASLLALLYLVAAIDNLI